ncbi:carbohydrate kinase [Planctomycetota bacterium]|nr:carbohydrate kinase [Planctomycetota bacterium]
MKPAAQESAYLAIDLGASSGRVMLGHVRSGTLALHELHRFTHEVHHAEGHERWSFAALLQELEQGLIAAARQTIVPLQMIRSVGVDAWGVDFGLLDATGRLLGDPVCYRDRRTEEVLGPLFALVPRAELFQRTGIQCMPINTIGQLLAQHRAGEWPAAARHLLMIPDLVHHWLCSSTQCEVTNASTTQLLSATTRSWDQELLTRIGVTNLVMPQLVPAGTRLGTLREDLAARTGLPPIAVVAPGTHDTASAVAGTPISDGYAFLSSGTWSLVGVESKDVVLGKAALQRNVTNEAGVYGTNRLLKNVMGLWLLESCMKRWREQGRPQTYADLEQALLPLSASSIRIDPDDPRLLHPPDMEAAIEAQLRERGHPPVDDPVQLCHVILTSLAQRYAEIICWLPELVGHPIRGVHIIGGGSRNQVQAQLTADLTGLPVIAGPVEATALGNVLVQAIAFGTFENLTEARAALKPFIEREFLPRR